MINFVYTDNKEDSLISHSKLRFDDSDNNRNVQERFIYYYRPEDIPDMIKAWQESLKVGNVVDQVLKLSVIEHKIDTQNKPFVKAIPVSINQKLQNVYEIVLSRYTGNRKRVMLLCAGVHPREAATFNLVANFCNSIVTEALRYSKGERYEEMKLLKIMELWDINIILNLNPYGRYIDGSCAIGLPGNISNIYNIPGCMYRKNGRDMDIDSFSKIRSLNEENQKLFMLNPEKARKFRHRGGQYFTGHKQLESMFYRRYNKGVDLNRNCAIQFRDIYTDKNILYWSRSNDTLSSTWSGYMVNEPENKIFIDIFKRIKPDIYITVHCYCNKIITADMFVDPDSKESVIADNSKSVPSKYCLTEFLQSLPYFEAVTVYDSVYGIDNSKSRQGEGQKKTVNNDTCHTINDRSYVSCCYTDSEDLENSYGIRPKAQGNERKINEKISMPRYMSPLGIIRGEQTHCAYVMNEKERFVSFTLECGSEHNDGFYASHTEMIDMLCNASDIFYASMLNFDSLPKRTR